MLKGQYCCFEGVDGTGKTSTLKALSTELQKDEFKFILTKEPGGPKALRQEWSSLLHPYGTEYESFRELCVNNPQIPQLVKRALYKADSFYNWLSIIKPALEQNTLVLSDRSWVSDIAYGAALANVPAEDLFAFNISLVPEQHSLTKVIYLDCPEDVRERRLANNVADHADKIGLEARRRICKEYMLCLDKYVNEYIVISTDQPLDKVVKECKTFIYANCIK